MYSHDAVSASVPNVAWGLVAFHQAILILYKCHMHSSSAVEIGQGGHVDPVMKWHMIIIRRWSLQRQSCCCLRACDVAQQLAWWGHCLKMAPCDASHKQEPQRLALMKQRELSLQLLEASLQLLHCFPSSCPFHRSLCHLYGRSAGRAAHTSPRLDVQKHCRRLHVRPPLKKYASSASV